MLCRSAEFVRRQNPEKKFARFHTIFNDDLFHSLMFSKMFVRVSNESQIYPETAAPSPILLKNS